MRDEKVKQRKLKDKHEHDPEKQETGRPPDGKILDRGYHAKVAGEERNREVPWNPSGGGGRSVVSRLFQKKGVTATEKAEGQGGRINGTPEKRSQNESSGRGVMKICTGGELFPRAVPNLLKRGGGGKGHSIAGGQGSYASSKKKKRKAKGYKRAIGKRRPEDVYTKKKVEAKENGEKGGSETRPCSVGGGGNVNLLQKPGCKRVWLGWGGGGGTGRVASDVGEKKKATKRKGGQKL